jgi:V8-like Glu-specific endopeptidase
MISASIFFFAFLAANVLAGATHFPGIPTLGVLYTDSIEKHFCTASVVESKHGNVILTAGHCVSGTGKGLRFAPGYHDGKYPYGSYPVTAAYVHANWNKNHNIDYDFAFLTLGKGIYNGKSIDVQTAVGGNKLVTTDGYKNTVQVLGYNDGQQTPVQCRVGTYEAEAGQLGFDCGPFSGGTSGSPWLADYNTKTQRGNLIGNIGGLHTGGCTSGISYSPRYGAGTLSVFDRANEGSQGDSVRGGATSGC